MHCVVTIEDPFKIHNYAKVFNADKTDTNDAFYRRFSVLNAIAILH